MGAEKEAELHPLLQRLQGGDRRSIGEADEVAASVRREPELFSLLIEGMRHDDELIRMRSADAAEKVTAELPEALEPYKDDLLGEIGHLEQQEVRWHVALMLPRLELDASDRQRACRLLETYLEDRSRIVRVSAMEAMAHLATVDERLAPDLIQRLEELTKNGSPAMRARGRKLLQGLR